MIAYTLLFASIVFIGEVFFPSYTVCTIDEKTQEKLCYGVPKKQIHSLMDESGMIDLEALDKLTN